MADEPKPKANVKRKGAKSPLLFKRLLADGVNKRNPRKPTLRVEPRQWGGLLGVKIPF